MIMMIEIEYGSDNGGEWTSRYRCTFHLPIDWCRRMLVPEFATGVDVQYNNCRGPGQTDVPRRLTTKSWHSKDAIAVFVAWHYSIINLDLPTPTVLGFRLAYVFTFTCDPYNHAEQQ